MKSAYGLLAACFRALTLTFANVSRFVPCRQRSADEHRAFASLDAIVRNVPRTEQATYDKLAAAQTALYIVKPDEWGHFAAKRFREMEQRGVAGMRMLVESTMHTMAAEFKIKREPGQPVQYVQKVYDPNSTLTHKRSSAPRCSRRKR